MADDQEDLSGGVWFTANGIGFFVGNEEDAPPLYLSRYSKRLISQHPGIMEWIRENPAPKWTSVGEPPVLADLPPPLVGQASDTPGHQTANKEESASSSDPLIRWFRKLGYQFHLAGWHLLWRGVLFTRSNVEEVAAEFQKLPGNALCKVAGWPSDAVIEILNVDTGQFVGKILWKEFAGEKAKSADAQGSANYAGQQQTPDQSSASVSLNPRETKCNEPSSIRTYTMHDIEHTSPDSGRVARFDRPLKVTAGCQALEFGVPNPKTLLRFELGNSVPMEALDGAPSAKVRIWKRNHKSDEDCVEVGDIESVELIFDNKSLASGAGEMPFWLIDGLEFVSKKLREQYTLNQEGGLRIENLK